ncbi:hypothetical protein BZA77DRAFT_245697 [Pyronema omphalodes]|nr:hypothetical protein BZA77DRAFT_245697 [Pyronema omphalodes]
MEDVVEAVVEPVREQVLSTFVPSEENHKVSKDGTQTFKLQPGETLVIVGIYTLTVLKGSVHVLGTKLSSSSAPSTIYAPLTHSLPVLTAAVKKNTDAPTKISYIELHITPYSSPLLNIGRLLPTFTNIWGNQEGSTFTPLFTSTTPTPILSVPQSHTTLLKSISRSSSSSDPIILLTGAKSAGKSTLSRLLTNSLLRNGPVAYLDLDPGQPELSPPGMISLTLLSSPLLGPSFTHFTHKPKPTKQHHIGYPTPREDPGAYMRCVIDLLNTHRSQHPRVPLIINTFGWIKALGLELLTDIAQHAQVTDVIFLGGGGSAVAEVLGQGITFHELSSAASMATAQAGGMGGSGRFSPADLRALQTAAYFHPEDFSPLTHMKPWVVPYPGAIAGIDVLGEVIDAADTRDAVEGTVVGVLLVEDVMEPVMVGKGLPLVVGVAPEGAECVGLAVVRAVDTEKQEVQLLMPVTGEEIAGWGEKQVVLQRGRGEIGLVEMLTGKEYKDGEAPWLQMGGKDKGKVWRVRRNVMRRGQQ